MVKRDPVIARWMAIPTALRRAVRGLPAARLDECAGPEFLSLRQTVHHLVESNLVASNIILAALAKSGSTFDWTWVMPGATWMRRLGYHRAPVTPALETLTALTRHIAALLQATRGGLRRSVQLFDAPGAPLYTKTVSQILSDETKHAREHLEALPKRRRSRR